jgi:hypothetical protein
MHSFDFGGKFSNIEVRVFSGQETVLLDHEYYWMNWQ